MIINIKIVAEKNPVFFFLLSYFSINLPFMGKTTKYASKGLTTGALIKGIINVIEQRKRIQQTPGASLNWQELFVEAGIGALAGVVVGGTLGAIMDHDNSLEKPINTDYILNGMLHNMHLSPLNRDYLELRKKGEEIIQLFERKFSGLLKCKPMFTGSTEKGTALRKKFDID
ncbi:hypothetical protein, partial [Niastella populi]|uniref:hypothetical protein n=1 Tax=Niastella populi TaxID=550983 RepID=UPI00105455A1